MEEDIGDHQGGFHHNRSMYDHIFDIRQIREEKKEYIKTVLQLFIGFKEAFDSMRKNILYNIFIEFGIPMKPVRLILNEMFSNFCICKHLPDNFPVQLTNYLTLWS
jgi:hypothetical protein